jgi:hypothetical protein
MRGGRLALIDGCLALAVPYLRSMSALAIMRSLRLARRVTGENGVFQDRSPHSRVNRCTRISLWMIDLGCTQHMTSGVGE